MNNYLYSFNRITKNTYYLLIGLGALIICIPSFINNFPFLYADTGTYIYIGHTDQISEIRPLFYGLFIRHVSLKESIWLVVLAQGFITSWSIMRFMKTFFPSFQAFYSIVIISILTFSSGLGISGGMLMPDFFAPVMILMVTLFLFTKERPFKFYILPFLILWMALIAHHSHSYILFCVLFALILLKLFFRKNLVEFLDWKKIGMVTAFCLLGYLTIPALHYNRSGKFIRSQSTNVFLVNRMSQMGLLKPFLETYCDEMEFDICNYIEATPLSFLWSSDSPLQKNGGWVPNNKRYEKVVRCFFSDPHFVKKFAVKSIFTVIQQFFSFDCVRISPEKENNFPFKVIKEYLPEYIPEIQRSRQYNDRWSSDLINHAQKVLVFSAMLLLIYLFFFQKKYKILPVYRNLAIVIFLGLLANAFVCAGVSMVAPRFQSRIVWLLPFFTFVLFVSLRQKVELADGIDEF